MDLADKLLGEFKNKISTLEITPSSGGVFEVTRDDKLIYSKKETGEFPDIDEIVDSLL